MKYLHVVSHVHVTQPQQLFMISAQHLFGSILGCCGGHLNMTQRIDSVIFQ